MNMEGWPQWAVLELGALVLAILFHVCFLCMFEIFCKFSKAFRGIKVEIRSYVPHPLNSWIHFIMSL